MAARWPWWRGLRCYGGRTVAMVTARARALTLAYVGGLGRPGRARRRSYLLRCIAREGERKEGVVASRTFCPSPLVWRDAKQASLSPPFLIKCRSYGYPLEGG